MCTCTHTPTHKLYKESNSSIMYREQGRCNSLFIFNVLRHSKGLNQLTWPSLLLVLSSTRHRLRDRVISSGTTHALK